jgi:hypothetical protein
MALNGYSHTLATRVMCVFAAFVAAGSVCAGAPESRSFTFSLAFGSGVHSSSVADLEDDFVERYGFYTLDYNPQTAQYDTLQLVFSHYTLAAEAAVQLNIRGLLGVGPWYCLGSVRESLQADASGFDHRETMLRIHRIGLAGTYWFPSFEALTLYVGANAGYAGGELYRLAPLSVGYIEEDELGQFLSLAASGVECRGLALGLRLGLCSSVREGPSIGVVLRYDFARIGLGRDPLSLYPSEHNLHDISAAITLSYTTSRRRRRH